MLDLVVVAPHPLLVLSSPLARRATSASGPKQRRALPLLLLAGLGCVAFVLWREQRRRQASHSIDSAALRAPATRAAGAPQAGSPQVTPVAGSSDARRPVGVTPLSVVDTAAASARAAIHHGAPQRAARAVHRGQPGQLRELARELAQHGREAEAGLLQNYALLLERPGVNRARVLAEVTRMLQAAEDERNARAPARVWRRIPLPAKTLAVMGERRRMAR